MWEEEGVPQNKCGKRRGSDTATLKGVWCRRCGNLSSTALTARLSSSRKPLCRSGVETRGQAVALAGAAVMNGKR